MVKLVEVEAGRQRVGAALGHRCTFRGSFYRKFGMPWQSARQCNSKHHKYLHRPLVREISVLIEPREDGPVDMLITYVVGRCLWKPAYDIRLFNSDGSMKVTLSLSLASSAV
ncbi:unnamed protein product, partial [Hydatigera taeniaeformis]|uniref:MATH domain-containing protein n=1 Tax=Hydatigena taeniaeformis TaxID=6205 RepID=A0A0R3WYH1_HYDTA